MNTPKIIGAMLLILILGISAGVWWSGHSGKSANGSDATGERKVLYWHDPMVPGQKFDKPGKSPFMDMQLVPVYADEAGTDGGVKVSSNVTQSLGIRLGNVERGIAQQQLTAVGSVAFDERHVQLVQARVTGYVTKLFVKAALDPVRAGQSLAEITSPEWQEALQEYAVLLANESPRTSELRSAARARLKVLNIPASAIEHVERTKQVANTVVILSPIDGVITELGVREGAAFEAGAALFKINGLDSVWVNAQVPEAQVHAIPMRAVVKAHATAWPNEVFEGKVEALLPEVDATSRTFTVRVGLNNRNRKLSPGMFVSLEIQQPKSTPQLLVPNEAVIVTGQRTVVLVSNDDRSFAAKDVVTGGQIADKTIILKGLEEGQAIVLSGQFLIDSDASLKSTVDRLSSVASPPAGMDATHPVHLAEGTITAITADSVTLAHGPVPSLKWPEMTMGFKVPSKGLPPGLKVNDRVTFTFIQNENGEYQLDSIATLDSAQPNASKERKP